MGRVIGIDLGTTNSVLAAYIDDRAQIIENSIGGRTTPSMVGFPAKGAPVIGVAAKDQQVTNPTATIYSVKRFMGRRHREVASEEKIVPFEVVGKAHEFVKVRARKNLLTPQEVSAMILSDIKAQAEAKLGEEVDRAVITVPAYFNDAQRQATKDAGEIAGLKIERIINEPTAAALAYGMERRRAGRVIIFDFGGGTFDLSAMHIDGGQFKVLAVHGNTHLGGDDFDQRLMDIVADDFLRNHRFDIRTSPMALQRLKDAAEKAKTQLSTVESTEISLPFITVDENGPRHLQYTLTRQRFEEVCSDLFDELRKASRQLLADAAMSPGPNTEIVMVGGSTRIPKVQEIAREVFKTEKLSRSINPDEVVALGAATLGGVIQGDLHNVHLMDVTSRGLGVETAGAGCARFIEKNTPIPVSVSRVFSTPADNQVSVPINVLEGEGSVKEQNQTLALFQLRGIRRAPRGVPQIEVEFSIDANGILNVRATDNDTGKSQEVVVQGGSGLDRGEIDRMRRQGQEFTQSRQSRRERFNLLSHAENVMFDMSRWLEHNSAMMPVRRRRQIETLLGRLDRKIHTEDENAARSLLRKLDVVSSPYRKAG